MFDEYFGDGEPDAAVDPRPAPPQVPSDDDSWESATGVADSIPGQRGAAPPTRHPQGRRKFGLIVAAAIAVILIAQVQKDMAASQCASDKANAALALDFDYSC